MTTEFQVIADVSDIPEGEGRAFPFEGTMVAIFNENGEFSAINDFCPHMGASLSEGGVENGVVYCPWHAWKFSIKDGSWLDNPKGGVRCTQYELRLAGEKIEIRSYPKSDDDDDTCRAEETTRG